jgi:hypothetical protein
LRVERGQYAVVQPIAHRIGRTNSSYPTPRHAQGARRTVSRHLSSSLTSSSTTQRRTAAPLRGRRLAAAGGLLLVVPLAAGCGAGFDNASQQVKPNSGAGIVGNIRVNNVWVVVDPATGNAEVIGAVANTGSSADTLQRVTATNIVAKVSGSDASTSTTGITVAGDSVSIPGGQSVSFGQSGNPELGLADVDFQAGLLSQVTFTFAQAGSVTVTAQIQPNNGQFADYNPNGAVPEAIPMITYASPTAIASGTATSTGTPTSTPTATGTATKSTSTSAIITATPTGTATRS